MEIRYIPYYGYCRIYIMNRSRIVLHACLIPHLTNVNPLDVLMYPVGLLSSRLSICPLQSTVKQQVETDS